MSIKRKEVIADMEEGALKCNAVHLPKSLGNLAAEVMPRYTRENLSHNVLGKASDSVGAWTSPAAANAGLSNGMSEGLSSIAAKVVGLQPRLLSQSIKPVSLFPHDPVLVEKCAVSVAAYVKKAVHPSAASIWSTMDVLGPTELNLTDLIPGFGKVHSGLWEQVTAAAQPTLAELTGQTGCRACR